MASIGKLLLNTVCVIPFIFGAWQVIGLLPVLTWLKSTDQITAAIAVFFIVKLVWLTVSACIFLSARWLKRKFDATPANGQ